MTSCGYELLLREVLWLTELQGTAVVVAGERVAGPETPNKGMAGLVGVSESDAGIAVVLGVGLPT